MMDHVGDEDRAFAAFKATGSQEALIALIAACNGPIFRLCHRILRRSEDAEDAAQDALLEMLEGIGTLRDPRNFRHWLWRLSVNTALDHARRRTTRRHHEGRAIMPTPNTPDPREVEALFEGLSRLDDQSRSLLIDHYFEGVTLTAIAAREDLSKMAVSKRLERARGRLKGTLAGLIPGLDMDKLLAVEGSPSPLPPVGEAVLAKAALVVAGGITVGTKSAMSAAAIVTILICLAVGIPSGIAILSRRSDGGESSIPRPSIRLGDRIIVSKKSNSVAEPTPSEGKEIPSTITPLRTRLEQYKLKLDQEFPERIGMKAKKVKDDAVWDYLKRLQSWKEKELAGVRELVLSDPQSLLDFFKSAAAGDYLEGLLEPGVVSRHAPSEFEKLPKALVDGLLAMLCSGTPDQRTEILRLAGYVKNKSDEFTGACLSLLSDDDPCVRGQATWQIVITKESLTESQS